MAAVIEQFTLRLPPDLKAQLKEEASQHRTSLNEKTVEILRAWFTPVVQETDDGQHPGQ